jgi:hypothetical protein
MKRNITILILVIGLGALLWLGYQNRRLSTDLEQTRDALRTSARETEIYKRSMEERAEPVQATASVPAPTSVAAASSDRAAQAVKPTIDAAWRTARFNEMILGVEAKYGRFFQKLKGWPPEKLEALKRQLAANEVAMLETIITNGNPVGDAATKALQQTIQDIAAKNQQLLRENVGDADFAKLDAVEKMEPYRESVGSITNAMRSKGVDVTGELDNSILAAYATAVQDAAREATPINMSSLSEEERAALKKQQAEAFRIRLLKQMSGVLDEKQLQIFMETEIEQGGGG